MGGPRGTDPLSHEGREASEEVDEVSTADNPLDMSGRVAVVTGAGSGIGRASAQALAAAGAAVVCADLDANSADETAALIDAQGGTATGATVDVADRQAVDQVVEAAVRRHGRLDVMCNIAGTMVDASILELGEEDLDRIIGVNLKGVLFGCQAAGRVMVEQGSGAIVNMASAAVLTPTPGVGAYAITKAGVVQITRIMATEVGPKGVRVNAVAPGFVVTKLSSRYWRRPDGSEDQELADMVLKPMARAAPLRRLGQVDDMANCVLYLASDAASFMTGQLLSPNGGVAMH